jgi:hypothetical protein
MFVSAFRLCNYNLLFSGLLLVCGLPILFLPFFRNPFSFSLLFAAARIKFQHVCRPIGPLQIYTASRLPALFLALQILSFFFGRFLQRAKTAPQDLLNTHQQSVTVI